MYCGQTAGWIKMPLGMDVGLGPGDFVLDGDPALPYEKGHSSPYFRNLRAHALPASVAIIRGPCLLWSDGWMDQDEIWQTGWPRPRRHCVRRGPSFPSPKGHSPTVFGPCLLWPNGRQSRLLLSTCIFYYVIVHKVQQLNMNSDKTHKRYKA